ncbi:FecR family protein, partial [Patescibacteria group bacterium]|nr:FecR family protein [Patescibacteria group bacterium]
MFNKKKLYIIGAIIATIFLSVCNANAQSVRDHVSPRAACKDYYGQAGFTVVRDLEHDCLVRSGENGIFLYTHYYDSGNNFCLEVTGSMGRVFGPQCIGIAQSGRTEQAQKTSPGKLATPPSFQIKELQYDTLPIGKAVKSGDDERIEIEMPDGSLIQLDAGATFTPVSDHEVQSVFGRYRYMWQPFHDGNCIVGQSLARQACRKVKTRDAILGITGTEFLVETDETGTRVTVLDGSLAVTDLGGKKTVEVKAGQTTFIKHGGVPEDPTAYDPAKIDRWWEKKTQAQATLDLVMLIALGFVLLFVIILYVKRKQIWLSKDLDNIGPAVGSLVLGLLSTLPVLSYYSTFLRVPQSFGSILYAPYTLAQRLGATLNGEPHFQIFFILLG